MSLDCMQTHTACAGHHFYVTHSAPVAITAFMMSRRVATPSWRACRIPDFLVNWFQSAGSFMMSYHAVSMGGTWLRTWYLSTNWHGVSVAIIILQNIFSSSFREICAFITGSGHWKLVRYWFWPANAHYKTLRWLCIQPSEPGAFKNF